MNKRQVLLIALLAILLLACIKQYDYDSALEICLGCGWTGVSGVGRNASSNTAYCTRVRDGNSETRDIEVVKKECPALLQKTLEAMPDD